LYVHPSTRSDEGKSAWISTVTHSHFQVHLQTQKGDKISMPRLAVNIFKSDGVGGFYSGLTASVMRQMTYTFMRFGAYETLKKQVPGDSFVHKVMLAGLAGAAGGMVTFLIFCLAIK
jgi:dicarboxylate transporter 10